MNKIEVIITVVISIAQYLTNKGEHTTLYKINKNLHQNFKNINFIVITLYSSHTTHTQSHRRNAVSGGGQGWLGRVGEQVASKKT